jgi:hypothetical protein
MIIFVVFIFQSITIAECNSKLIIERPVEELDPLGRYQVSWEVNLETELVTFNVVAQTTGFVGFGISNSGGMAGADIVIGGVWPNGTAYFKDYHGLGSFDPALDISQDWNLLSLTENQTHTHMSFSRLLDTCDEQDVSITNDTSNFIWSFGPTDRIGYHGPNRGTHSVNILDPPMPEADLTKLEKWNVHRNMTMPPVDTSYWCTTHKMPKFEGKHHVVAFGVHLPSQEALKHTHHLTVFKCTTPEGADPAEFFEPFVGAGGECWSSDAVPNQYCSNILYVWAVGGKPMIFPDNIGYPINELGLDEYVMMEIHYDNPDVLHNVSFVSGVDVYHTAELRPVEAAMLLVSHSVVPSHLIPPKVEDYVTVGHCSPKCTADNFPEDGITIFNILLHAHKSGRKLKLRHFRNGTELPWVGNDANYDFDYQQNRPLRQPIVVLPGDQLSYECTTDSTWTDGAVIGGLSTRHEMCEVFLWTYPRQDIGFCSSFYPDYPKLFGRFGIEDVDWNSDYFDPTVLAPPHLANKTFSRVVSEFAWTTELKEEVEQDLRYSPHSTVCSAPAKSGRDKFSLGHQYQYVDDMVTYPNIDKEYNPPNKCDV